MKKSKKPKSVVEQPKYFTVGVRFLSSNVSKVYTYCVARSKKVHHGDLLVADTPSGPAVVAVVRIDSIPQDIQCGITYKYLEKKVAEL